MHFRGAVRSIFKLKTEARTLLPAPFVSSANAYVNPRIVVFHWRVVFSHRCLLSAQDDIPLARRKNTIWSPTSCWITGKNKVSIFFFRLNVVCGPLGSPPVPVEMLSCNFTTLTNRTDMRSILRKKVNNYLRGLGRARDQTDSEH